MSRPITPAYTFAPAGHQINLTGISGFDLRLLVGIVNLTTGGVVYGRGLPGYGCSAVAGTLLTLQAPLAGMAASDVLVIKYDDLGLPSQDGTDATGIAMPAGGAGIRGWLSGMYAYLGTLAGAVAAGVLKVAPQSNAPRVSSTAALAALNASVTLAVDGMGTAGVQISGTWAGTIAWSGSLDGGDTYFSINLKPLGAGGGPSIGSATANGQWDRSAAPYTHIKATMTAWTSGSASVLLTAVNGTKIARVEAPAGDPLPTVDANNAPFSAATALTAGQPSSAGKSVGVNATAAGNIVLTLAGGGMLTLPIFTGWQTFPFAATAFALSGGAAASVYNLS